MKQLRHITTLLWLALPLSVRASDTSVIDVIDVIDVIESTAFTKEETSDLARALGISVGDALDPRRVNEGIKAVHQRGKVESLFVEVIGRKGRHVAVLSGARSRVLRTLTFKNVDAEILASVQRGLSLEEGKIVDMRAFTELRDRIKEAYQERGYAFAEVDVILHDVAGSTEADVEVVLNTGKATEVSAVLVTGGTPEENTSLAGLVGIRKGDTYSRRAVDEAAEKINRYLRANQYPTSKVEQVLTEFSENKLEVEIRLLVKLEDRFLFQFRGNTIFEDVTIRSMLTEEVLSQIDATAKVVELLETKYREIGNHFAKVAAKEESFKSQKLKVVTFDVDEGPKVILDTIHVNGGEPFTERQLGRMFLAGAPGALARGVYWEKGLAAAADTLKRTIVEDGYLSATVGAPRAVFTPDNKGVDLFLDVDPGTRTFVAQIDPQGFFHFPQSKILQILGVKAGDPINRKAVDEGRAKILEAYSEAGYVDAKYQDGEGHETIQLSGSRKECVIRLHLVEGVQYLVGDISVVGNEKTQAEVILREMKLATGDRYDPRLLRQSEEDIALLGLFTRAEILASNSASHPNRKDLKIVVKENRPGLGEVGFGGEFEDPTLRLKSFFGLTYRNLMGLNQTASVRGEVSLPFTSDKFIPFVEYAAVLGYRAPYPFKIPISFATQIGLDGFQIASIGPKIQRRARIELRIEKKISKSFTAVYRLYRYERTSTELLASSVTTPSLKVDIIGSTGPGLILDLRNDSFNPTSGSYHTADAEFAHPSLLSGSNTAFAMVVNRNSFYLPIFSPFQLSAFVGVGYARSLLSGRPLPTARLDNDLALGGQGSIRGFSVRVFAPSDTSTETAFYNVRSELGVGIFTNVTFALFFDSGQIFPNLKADRRHDGVGFGVRYKTPVGPLVVDIAQGLGPDKESVKLYFTVGTF